MFSPPVLIEIRDEMFKDHPKKEDGPFYLPSAFPSSRHFTSSLQCGRVSFAGKRSSGTELLKLG